VAATILVVELSFSLLLLQNLHHSVDQLGEFGVLSIIALGTAYGCSSVKQNKIPRCFAARSGDSRKVIAQVEGAVSQLEIEQKPSGSVFAEPWCPANW